MRASELETSSLSNLQKFKEAMSNIKVISVEDENQCRALSYNDIESLDKVWTVDSRLVQSLEGVCGILGIDQPVGKMVLNLGKNVHPAIPSPRIPGMIDSLLLDREIEKIHIYPEERFHRIDICWGKGRSGKWTSVPTEYFIDTEMILGSLLNLAKKEIESIWICSDPDVSSECPNLDLIIWRNRIIILATSPIPCLLKLLGLNKTFGYWLKVLISQGQIPIEKRPNLKQQLNEANCPNIEEFIDHLVIPFEKRFGDSYRSGRLTDNFISKDIAK